MLPACPSAEHRARVLGHVHPGGKVDRCGQPSCEPTGVDTDWEAVEAEKLDFLPNVPCSSDCCYAEHSDTTVCGDAPAPLRDSDVGMDVRAASRRHHPSCSRGLCDAGTRSPYHNPAREIILPNFKATLCSHDSKVDIPRNRVMRRSQTLFSPFPFDHGQQYRATFLRDSHHHNDDDNRRRTPRSEVRQARGVADRSIDRRLHRRPPATITTCEQTNPAEVPELGRGGFFPPVNDCSDHEFDGEHDSDAHDEIDFDTVGLDIVDERSHRSLITPYMRRPTLTAKLHDAHLPLHVQKPPVKHLSWDHADAVVARHAEGNEATIWFLMTAIFRNPAIARIFNDARDATLDVLDEASQTTLFNDDISVMEESSFCKRCDSKSEFAAIKVFSVVETQKCRRRIIGWPRSVNEAERLVLNTLKQDGYRVSFPDIGQLKRRVLLKYACQLDLHKFFQQFPLITKEFFEFLYNSRVYQLDTIPTGGASPPVNAQVLTKSCVRAALKRSHTEELVQFDAIIDNVRLSSDDFDALGSAWNALIQVLGEVGITIGEMQPPTHNMNVYVFAGIEFDHTTQSVSPAQKTVTKLRTALVSLTKTSPIVLSLQDISSIFGVCVWASAILDTALAHVYWIFKFIRRTYRKYDIEYEADVLVPIWPSILPLWCKWIEHCCTTTTKVYDDRATTRKSHAFVDASNTGYGIVIFPRSVSCRDHLRLPTFIIIGGSWSDAERNLHINVKELLAVKKLVLCLQLLPSRFTALRDAKMFDLTVYIDNTTAESWVTKKRSKNFLASAILEDIIDAQLPFPCRLEMRRVTSAENPADWPSRVSSTETPWFSCAWEDPATRDPPDNSPSVFP